MANKRNNKGTNDVVLAASPDLPPAPVPIEDARARILANSPSHLLGCVEYVSWVRSLTASENSKVGVIVRFGSQVEAVYHSPSLSRIADCLMTAAAYDIANNKCLPLLLAADTANGEVWIIRFKAEGVAFRCVEGAERENQPHKVDVQPIILGKEYREKEQ